MSSRSRRALVPLLTALPLGLLVSGCGDDGLDRAELERAVSARMDDESSPERGTPDAVRCAGGLHDAGQRCTAIIGRQMIGVTVLPSDDAEGRGWDWRFDPGLTLAGDDVATRLGAAITRETGRLLDRVTCPEDLPGLPDATTTCELVSGSERHHATVTVTTADGADVAFRYEIDDAS